MIYDYECEEMKRGPKTPQKLEETFYDKPVSLPVILELQFLFCIRKKIQT
jgi:hypothetical protein